MSRITLAFGCFFQMLFGGTLPARAAKYLPAGSLPEPEPGKPATALEAKPEAKPEAKTNPAEDNQKNQKNQSKNQERHRDGSLALLALLQREGRFVDFMREEIDGYDDADIGAAVRDVHRGCSKVLRDHLTIEAVMPGEEDDSVTIGEGFDPSEVKLVGNVAGDPPFRGVMRHHGWRVTEANFPKLTGEIDRRVLAPAEVEVK